MPPCFRGCDFPKSTSHPYLQEPLCPSLSTGAPAALSGQYLCITSQQPASHSWDPLKNSCINANCMSHLCFYCWCWYFLAKLIKQHTLLKMLSNTRKSLTGWFSQGSHNKSKLQSTYSNCLLFLLWVAQYVWRVAGKYILQGNKWCCSFL